MQVWDLVMVIALVFTALVTPVEVVYFDGTRSHLNSRNSRALSLFAVGSPLLRL